jgi:hypothetical protein
MSEDEAFLAAFETGTWPFEKWHHREHIRVAYLYLCRFPYPEALEKMQSGIKALNIAHKVPEKPGRGYHETITQAWMRLTHQAFVESGKAETSEAFLSKHPTLTSKDTLLAHYAKERLMSAEARRQFVEPDLNPLPQPPSTFNL